MCVAQVRTAAGQQQLRKLQQKMAKQAVTCPPECAASSTTVVPANVPEESPRGAAQLDAVKEIVADAPVKVGDA